MAYNPYDAVNAIYNFKKQWHTADAQGDKKTADESAKKAQEYYAQLRDNGYSDLADNLSNTNDAGAKAIADYLAKNSMAKTKTITSTPVTSATPTSIKGKVDNLYGIQTADRNVMAGKYDTLEDYNYNHNPYESEIGKSIMEDYKFKGKTASDNAVASGAGANSGNIDSYAAANANRQQLAFTNAGKQAVLNDFNTRIQNAKDILTNLGVYQQNQDKGMQTTINQQQTEEQRVFENEQTAKNNDVARKQTIAEVTGYAPDEWVNANNMFLDENGKLKPEYENVDFKALMTNAKDENVRKQASVARAVKIFGNYEKYGQYDDGDYSLNGSQQTEVGRQFDTTADLTKREIDTKSATEKYLSDNSLIGTKYTSDNSLAGDKYQADSSYASNKYVSDNSLAGDKYKVDKAIEAEQTGSNLTLSQAISLIKSGIPSEEAIKVFNDYAKTNYTIDNPPILDGEDSEEGGLLADIEETTTSEPEQSSFEQYKKIITTNGITKEKTTNFLSDVLYHKELRGEDITDQGLKELILANTEAYDIDVEDARKILNMYGADASWLSGYENRWGFNGGKGMKQKK